MMQVGRVLDEMEGLIERHIAKRSVGLFTLPGLVRVKVVAAPARPAKKGVPNSFRPGETMDVAAKPASRKVKVLPLKKLKAMIRLRIHAPSVSWWRCRSSDNTRSTADTARRLSRIRCELPHQG